MTYKSTPPIPIGDCDVKPLRTRHGVYLKREIFGSAQVRQVVDDPATAQQFGFPTATADALIASYMSGRPVVLSLCGDGAPSVHFERLKNHDEVWVICIRNDSKQQWRIFGRFLKQNIFVALAAYPRAQLKGKRYDQAATKFIAHWACCFPRAPFIRGDHFTDYVSRPARDICEGPEF